MDRGFVSVPVIAPLARPTIGVSPALLVVSLVLGAIDSWPTEREIDQEIARILFPQLEDAERVENSFGVELSATEIDCSQGKAVEMIDRAGGAMIEALAWARTRENASGVRGDQPGTTTAVGLYCIDGFAGSVLGRNARGSTAPEGFARITRSSYGPIPDGTFFHAETNILSSITEYVRPTRGSSGFVIILPDNDLCGNCKGFFKRWTEYFPGIAVYAADPTHSYSFVGGVQTTH